MESIDSKGTEVREGIKEVIGRKEKEKKRSEKKKQN